MASSLCAIPGAALAARTSPSSARRNAARRSTVVHASADARTPGGIILPNYSANSFSQVEITSKQGGPSPQVMQSFQGAASQLMAQRILRLGGAVDDDKCNLIVAQLLWLDATDPKADITLYINSPGGSVTAGMAVFDTLRHVRPDVSTVCVGLAASMGAFLLAAGEQGKRYSLPNSRIMIHQPLGGAQGQAADIEIQANEIMHHKSTLNGYIAEFTGKSLDTVMEDTDRDFFMSALEAKDYGLIDFVIEHPTEIAVRSSGIPLYAGDNLY